jgi:hypothetical protein
MSWTGARRSLGWLSLILLAGTLVGSSTGACSDPCASGCGTCVQSFEEFCDGYDCTFSGYECGDEGAYSRQTETGCGYVSTYVVGPETEFEERFYDEESGELVFARNYGGDDGPCDGTTVAGTLPDCSTWADACDEVEALGGAAGAGP